MRLVAFLLAVLAPSPVFAVRVPREVSAMVVHSSGDVIVAMPKAHGPDDVHWSVARVDLRARRLRWQYWLSRHRVAQDYVDDLVLTADGDVIAVGTSDAALVAVRLDATNGHVRWRSLVRGTATGGRGLDAALGGDGELAIAGTLAYPNPNGLQTAAVVLLDAATGAERWRFVPPPDGSDGQASAVAVGADGDVFAAGGNQTIALWRLGGADGAVRWRRDFGTGSVEGLALDASDDPVLAVFLSFDPARQSAVTRTDATTGAARWTTYDGDTGVVGSSHLAVAGGAVFVTGTGVASRDANDSTLVVSRLDGALGTVSWTRTLSGPFGARAATLVPRPPGGVSVGGFTSSTTTCRDGLLLTLDATGAILETRVYDGTATARRPRPGCTGSFPRVDNDRIDQVAADGAGRVFVAGGRVDRVGGRPRERNFVEALSD